MALIPICHTPKPGLRRKRLGAGDVIQYLRFDKPSDHGQFRDGKTQTRASHRISHDPKDYLAPVVRNRDIGFLFNTRKSGLWQCIIVLYRSYQQPRLPIPSVKDDRGSVFCDVKRFRILKLSDKQLSRTHQQSELLVMYYRTVNLVTSGVITPYYMRYVRVVITPYSMRYPSVAITPYSMRFARVVVSPTIDVSTARMVANHRKWGLSVPYSGRRTVSHNLANRNLVVKTPYSMRYPSVAITPYSMRFARVVVSPTIDVSTARMVANHRKWGLSVPYSGRRTVSHNLANV
ncbi:hypothetical protein LXL04_007964 [Taraxacum kok-saghyz]